MNTAIVVPMYKEEMTNLERISFLQMIRVLDRYDIYIVAPESLPLPKEVMEHSLFVEYFKREYFQSIASYNQLMLSKEFYGRFIIYDYILIYQLDAFVFYDRLEYFCNLGYDYIGAPWLSGVSEYLNIGRRVIYVGNGGLSLRKVESCRCAVIKRKAEYDIYKNRNEDIFFSVCDGEDFRVAPVSIALEFAFEREVKRCFAVNNKKLPFGCHAWEKYDFTFFKKYIEAYGYDFKNLNLKCGNLDDSNKKEYCYMQRVAELLENDEEFYGLKDKVSAVFADKDENPLFLWGAGHVGRFVGKLFADCGISIEGYIDANADLYGILVEGYQVYSPKKLNQNSRIVITTDKKLYRDIMDKLQKIGLVYRKNYIVFEDILPESNKEI